MGNSFRVIPFSFVVGSTLNLILVFLISFSLFGNVRFNWVVFDIAVIFFFFFYILAHPFSFGIVIKERKLLFLLIILLNTFFVISVVNLQAFGVIQIVKQYYYLRAFLFIQIFVLAQNEYPEKMEMFLKSLFIFVVIFFFVNIPFILRQFQQGYYKDDINGLFGSTANAPMALFFLLVLALLRFYRRANFLILGVFTVISLFLSLLASIRIFIVFLAILWLYILYEKGLFSSKTVLYILFTSVGSYLLFTIFLSYHPLVAEEIDYLFDLYVRLYFSSDAPGGEREGMVAIAFSSSDILWGEGIGSVSDVLGFEGSLLGDYPLHINMNDLGTVLVEGGVFYYVFLVLSISICISNLFPYKGISNLFNFLIILGLINFLFFYTRFVSDPRRLVMGVLIFVVIGDYLKRKK